MDFSLIEKTPTKKNIHYVGGKWVEFGLGNISFSIISNSNPCLKGDRLAGGFGNYIYLRIQKQMPTHF